MINDPTAKKSLASNEPSPNNIFLELLNSPNLPHNDPIKVKVRQIISHADQLLQSSNPSDIIQALTDLEKAVEALYGITRAIIQHLFVVGFNFSSIDANISLRAFTLASHACLKFPLLVTELIDEPVIIQTVSLIGSPQSNAIINLIANIISSSALAAQQLFEKGFFQLLVNHITNQELETNVLADSIDMLNEFFVTLPDETLLDAALPCMEIIIKYIFNLDVFYHVARLFVNILKITDDPEIYSFFFENNIDTFLIDTYFRPDLDPRVEVGQFKSKMMIIKIFQNIAGSSRDHVQVALERGLIDHMQRIIDEGNEKTQTAALRVLINCCAISIDVLKQILDNKVGDLTLFMLNNGSFESKKIAARFLCCVFFAVQDDRICQYCIEIQAVQVLLDLLQFDDKKLTYYIIPVLYNAANMVSRLKISLFEHPLFQCVGSDRFSDVIYELSTTQFAFTDDVNVNSKISEKMQYLLLLCGITIEESD